jgi:hypothetical protein
MVEITYYDMIMDFIIGMIGSATYLFVLLILNGDINILRNKIISARFMAPLFIIVGGFVTLVYALSLGQPFVPIDSWKIFVVGFGWQGLLVSYSIAKKAVAGEKTPEIQEAARNYQRERDRLAETLTSYIKKLAET